MPVHVINDKRVECMTQGVAWAGKDVATYLKEVEQELESKAYDEAKSIESELKQAGLDVKVRIERGAPQPTILNIAEEEGDSAIVIGSHVLKLFWAFQCHSKENPPVSE